MLQNQPHMLTPGPSLIHPEVFKLFQTAPFHHRSPEFQEKLLLIQPKLQSFFQTSSQVLLLNCSGTGAMEACLENGFAENDNLLFYTAGKFGNRWYEMGLKKKYSCHRIEDNWGRSLDLHKLKSYLINTPKKPKAFFIQACETSTGAQNPLKPISDILKEHSPETLFYVDAISALGSYQINMDRDKIDCLITGSQKALGLPTGLSFISLSERALLMARKISCKSTYFDLVKESEAQKQNLTQFSGASIYLAPLLKSLELLTEDIQDRYKRSLMLQSWNHFFWNQFGFDIFPTNPSPSLSVFTHTKPSDQLLTELNKKGFILSGGQGNFENKLIRIGHLGFTTNLIWFQFFKTSYEILLELNYTPIQNKESIFDHLFQSGLNYDESWI